MLSGRGLAKPYGNVCTADLKLDSLFQIDTFAFFIEIIGVSPCPFMKFLTLVAMQNVSNQMIRRHAFRNNFASRNGLSSCWTIEEKYRHWLVKLVSIKKPKSRLLTLPNLRQAFAQPIRVFTVVKAVFSKILSDKVDVYRSSFSGAGSISV